MQQSRRDNGFSRAPARRPGQRGPEPVRRLRDLPTSPKGFAITIVLSLMNHPWLLDRFAEEVAHLDLRQSSFARLLAVVTQAIHQRPGEDPAALAEALAEQREVAKFLEAARDSAFSRLSFLRDDTPEDEVEEQFKDLLFRWRALPTLKRELLEVADDLAEGSDAEFEQFAILQTQVANDGVAEAHEDAGDRDAIERFRERIARLKRERAGFRRGNRPAERR
jgi:DNA primase